MCKRTGLPLPDREDRIQANICKSRFSVPTNVLKEEVSEEHVTDPRQSILFEYCLHPCFILVVGGVLVNPYLLDRQPDRLALFPEEGLSHPVHAHPIEVSSHRG